MQMAHYHACVWLDHREAKIFGLSEDDFDETEISDTASSPHIHRKADHVGVGKVGVSPTFLGEVAALLEPYKAILIAGPGTARNEFAGFLNEHHPKLAQRVWGIEAMDHPTRGELIAAARKYFRAADRMHG
jgi:stalled ribosome rescue protein Dom34